MQDFSLGLVIILIAVFMMGWITVGGVLFINFIIENSTIVIGYIWF